MSQIQEQGLDLVELEVQVEDHDPVPQVINREQQARHHNSTHQYLTQVRKYFLISLDS